MKTSTRRKHGLKARQSRMHHMAVRPIVSLMCEGQGQSYVWITARGRDRVIKH